MILFKISSLTDRVYGELIEPIPKITLPQAKHNLIAFPVVSLSNPLLGLSFLILCLSMCSCGATRTIPVETIKEITKVDTIYLNTFRFDSTYVSHERTEDYRRSKTPILGYRSDSVSSSLSSADTVIIKDVSVEYRYRLLTDTIERVKIVIQRDSIPYEVRVESIKEVARTPLPVKLLAWIGGIFLLLLTIWIIRKSS